MRLIKAAILTTALAAASVMGTAQIEQVNLDQMVARTDNTVHGTIVNKEVIRIDHPVDGPELYYTHLIIEGKSLVDGKDLNVTVTFPGGFIDAENGVWNSEAPSDADTKIGTEIVAFYKWSENMGGDLASNALYASHGGLFRTLQGRKGTVIQGRGEGYAIANNIKLTHLDTQITAIAKSLQDAEKQSK